jgi:hypothetical protein
MSTFKHTPFDLERPGIRLLRLLKGEDSLIECELFQAWHDGDDTDYIPYEALSYTWGGMEMAASVRIATQTHGVTENLYLALQHLRYRDEDRILWVDAICIDQSNSKERGHQVNQMRTIYTRADRVLIWLGPASDDAYVLLDSLKRLEQRSKRNWSLEDKRWPETWQSLQPGVQDEYGKLLLDRQLRQRAGLASLLQRPWFRRVWILQEIANANRATICCGTKSVSARVFAIAPKLVNLYPEPHVQAVLDIMPGWSRENSWWSSKRDLRALLFMFRSSEAGDPRDKIYALLGMSSDCTGGAGMCADYTKDLSEVVCDTTIFLFNFRDRFYTMADLSNYIIAENIRTLNKIVKTECVQWVSKIVKSCIRDCITSGVIEGAAGNTHCGEDMMSFILKQGKRSAKIAKITSKVIRAAAQNKSCGKKILGILYKARQEDLLGTIALHDHETILAFLLEQHGDKIRLTPLVVHAAAENLTCGWKVLRMLLKLPYDRLEIGDDVVYLAKLVTMKLAKLLEKRVEEVTTAGLVMWNDQKWENVCQSWDIAFKGDLGRDPGWSPLFDKTWNPWFSEGWSWRCLMYDMTDDRGIDNFRDSGKIACLGENAQRELLSASYSGWKQVLLLLRDRRMSSEIHS